MNSSNNLPLSRRALSAEASPIREMANLASQYKGDDLVSLAIGEPDFTTPSHIFIERCQMYRENPPVEEGETWDGVFTATAK